MRNPAAIKYTKLLEKFEAHEREELKRRLAMWIKRCLKAETKLALMNPEKAIGRKTSV